MLKQPAPGSVLFVAETLKVGKKESKEQVLQSSQTRDSERGKYFSDKNLIQSGFQIASKYLSHSLVTGLTLNELALDTDKSKEDDYDKIVKHLEERYYKSNF